MNRISLTDLAQNEPMKPLLEKEVQGRAYELYEQRGRGHGFALQDWLEAEGEVLARGLYRSSLLTPVELVGAVKRRIIVQDWGRS